MLRFFIFLAVAVLAVKAYDFSDFDYNQYILNEFELLNEDVSFLRQKRDTEIAAADKKECSDRRGDWKKEFACCADDKLDTEHVKQMKEIKRTCAGKVRANNSDAENFDPFDCDKMDRIKQLIICEDECIARAISILDHNDKLNRQAILKRFADHMVGESEWKMASYEGYIDKCLAQVESKQKEIKQQCNSAPMEFHHCVWGEFINGCPADLQIKSHKCNKMRERHAQGSNHFLNKHLLHGFLHRGHSAEKKDI